jgi:hypothetical protein
VTVTSQRDPVNELYDRGCDLVDAAAAIRRATASPAAAGAAPALLGCIEHALAELEDAALALGVAADVAVSAAPHRGERTEERRKRMRDGFARLEAGLRDAKDVAAASRALAARALEQADVTGAAATGVGHAAVHLSSRRRRAQSLL